MHMINRGRARRAGGCEEGNCDSYLGCVATVIKRKQQGKAERGDSQSWQTRMGNCANLNRWEIPIGWHTLTHPNRWEIPIGWHILTHPNRWEVPLEHSVEPGWHQFTIMVPRPIIGQFKHRGRVQFTEKPLRISKLRMSWAQSILCSRVKSQRSDFLLWYPLWQIEESTWLLGPAPSRVGPRIQAVVLTMPYIGQAPSAYQVSKTPTWYSHFGPLALLLCIGQSSWDPSWWPSFSYFLG